MTGMQSSADIYIIPPVVMHLHNHAVIVAIDIEHYPVTPHKAGIAMCSLDVRT
jgi:hypothetical protein